MAPRNYRLTTFAQHASLLEIHSDSTSESKFKSRNLEIPGVKLAMPLNQKRTSQVHTFTGVGPITIYALVIKVHNQGY